MGTSPNDIAAINAAVPSSETRFGSVPLPPKTAQGKKSDEVQTVAPEVTMPTPDRILVNELEGANEEIRTIARQIRQVDDTMNVIGQNLDKMSASLESIVKNYPPYPQGSEERVAALRRFSGLRQMIDKLTVPAPNDDPIKILGDKSRYSDAGDWSPAATSGQKPLLIHHQPVHSGAEGLDLPDLANDATDDAIHVALGRMARSHEVFQKRRQAFAGDANRVLAAFF